MAKKRGAKGRIKFMFSKSPAAKKVKEAAKNVGESLGLYPEAPTPAAPKPKRACSEPGCDVQETHRHVHMHASEVDEPMHSPGPSHPAHRGLSFDQGSTEHLPKGVVSLNAYREAKARKKPAGY